MSDCNEEKLKPFFNLVESLLYESYKQNINMIIVCSMGLSRSKSILFMYLMYNQLMNIDIPDNYKTRLNVSINDDTINDIMNNGPLIYQSVLFNSSIIHILDSNKVLFDNIFSII